MFRLQIFSEFLAHTLVYSEFLDFVADSTYQSCYCLRVVKDMYVSKTFTAEYHIVWKFWKNSENSEYCLNRVWTLSEKSLNCLNIVMYYHTYKHAPRVLSQEFLDFVADSTYQSCYCLRVVKDMYVSKTFTAEYHYLKQRNFTFLSSLTILVFTIC
jgi:hypothetical protein